MMKTQLFVPALFLTTLFGDTVTAAQAAPTTTAEAGLRGSSKNPNGISRRTRLGQIGSDRPFWFYDFDITGSNNNNNQANGNGVELEDILAERVENMKHMSMEEMDEVIPVIAVVEGERAASERELEKSWDSFKYNWPDRPLCVLRLQGSGELSIPEDMADDGNVTIRTIPQDDLENGRRSRSSSSDWFRVCGLEENKIDSVAILVDVKKYDMVELSVDYLYERLEADGQHAEWIYGEKWNFVESANSMIMSSVSPTFSPTTLAPSISPTFSSDAPSTSAAPSAAPTVQPSMSAAPSAAPTVDSAGTSSSTSSSLDDAPSTSATPSAAPSVKETDSAGTSSTDSPSASTTPSAAPTVEETDPPTSAPNAASEKDSSEEDSLEETDPPTSAPSAASEKDNSEEDSLEETDPPTSAPNAASEEDKGEESLEETDPPTPAPTVEPTLEPTTLQPTPEGE